MREVTVKPVLLPDFSVSKPWQPGQGQGSKCAVHDVMMYLHRMSDVYSVRSNSMLSQRNAAVWSVSTVCIDMDT